MLRPIITILTWFPASAIVGTVSVMAYQSLSTYPSVGVVGMVITCGTLVWSAATVKKGITEQLDTIKAQLTFMVTKDNLELRLMQERMASDEKYVTADFCIDKHDALELLLEKVSKHQAKAKGAGGD